MAYKTSPRTGKKRTKQQQAMYRRRRIVFGIATVLVLSFTVFCLYSGCHSGRMSGGKTGSHNPYCRKCCLICRNHPSGRIQIPDII